MSKAYRFQYRKNALVKRRPVGRSTSDRLWTIAGWATGLLLVIYAAHELLHLPDWVTVLLFFLLLFVGLFLWGGEVMP